LQLRASISGNHAPMIFPFQHVAGSTSERILRLVSALS
jgi:hypothetical protein